MNTIDKLTEIFARFPGIGQRQARRFVYYLLSRNSSSIKELQDLLGNLHTEISVCKSCFRHFDNTYNKSERCDICSSSSRSQESLAIVSKDTDIEPVERSGTFSGNYFVIGGTIPILEQEPEKKIRIRELEKQLEEKVKKGLSEVILAMNWNPEGEYTAEYIEKRIKSNPNTTAIRITHLGKGLSMGTELEYADPDTLKNAFRYRH